jgi:type IV pilus assembly protein PilW
VRSRGFTLIELMISMALFGLIAAGAMALVMAGARTQAHSSRVDVAQSSLRTAIDFITRDVMMASAGASSGQVTVWPATVGVNTVNIGSLTLVNATGNGTGTVPSDTLDLYLIDGTIAAEIPGGVTSGMTSIPFVYEQGYGTVTSNSFPTAAPANSFLQVCDLKNAVVVPWTASSTTTITTSALPTAAFLPFAPNNTLIFPSRHVIYTVSATQFSVLGGAQANTSMLMMQVNPPGGPNEPLAEGIEDMQIAYGFDTNADGIVTEVVGGGANSDEWLYNAVGDTIQAQMTIGNLRTIRVTLVAKSTTTDSGAVFNNIPAFEDRGSAISPDGFIRRVLRTEIAVRNFNL